MEFELDLVELGEEDEARTTKRKSTRKRRATGRGAPGRPKSKAHRSAISAGMKRYWRSKSAKVRRRSKARKSGKKRTTSKRKSTGKKRKTTKRKPDKDLAAWKRNAKKGDAYAKRKIADLQAVKSKATGKMVKPFTKYRK